MKPKIIVSFIVAALLLVILAQNTQVVSVKLLFWNISMSRAILVFLNLVVGVIIGFFIGRKSWEW